MEFNKGVGEFMKYYDKRIYQIEKEIKEAFLILIIFILAFTFGFFIRESEVKEMQTKIESLESRGEEK